MTTSYSGLHARNRHRGSYDFDALVAVYPDLEAHIKISPAHRQTIDFFNPEAVRALNTALLFLYYDLTWWQLPKGALCPPIPGRADYIHYMADLLRVSHPAFREKKINQVSGIRCLDIGVGAACIYPIIGIKEYGWHFTGSDINSESVESARKIIRMNPELSGKAEIRLQPNANDTFHGIIGPGERFDLSICNPPFHASAEEAKAVAAGKLTGLKGKTVKNPTLNFGGVHAELWCEGGEIKFITDMIAQSVDFGNSVFWFSTLVSKKDHLHTIYRALKNAGAAEVKTIEMSNGNKVTRVVAWTFLPK